MSGDKDIRFVEPTSFVIQPRPKKGMARFLIDSFPGIIRTEVHANAVLVLLAVLCAAVSMAIIINSGSTGYARNPSPIYGED